MNSSRPPVPRLYRYEAMPEPPRRLSLETKKRVWLVLCAGLDDKGSP